MLNRYVVLEKIFLFLVQDIIFNSFFPKKKKINFKDVYNIPNFSIFLLNFYQLLLFFFKYNSLNYLINKVIFIVVQFFNYLFLIVTQFPLAIFF